MRYEQDYVMRMIKEMTEVLARIIFHRKTPFYELDMENKYRSGEDFYLKLCKLADAGKINEAENLLYEKLDREEQDYLEIEGFQTQTVSDGEGGGVRRPHPDL